MSLHLRVDYVPMEADTGCEIPSGPEWEYEPKWDGFRCLAFRDGKKLSVMSKSGQPLARYFPELDEALLGIKAEKFVLDGEVVIATARTLNFGNEQRCRSGHLWQNRFYSCRWKNAQLGAFSLISN